MAGRCSRKFVEPPTGRVDGHRVADRAVGDHVAHGQAQRRSAAARRARSAAPRRARSAGPRAPSAVCGSARPSASATTCAVAAVPRNWQPPPGDAQARQPISAACCQRDPAVREARAHRLRLARVLAVARGQGHAAGHDHRGQVAAGGQRHRHRGQALVARRHAQHRAPRWAASGSAAAGRSPRRCGRRGCPACRVVPCVRPSQGSVQKAAKGIAAQARGSPRPRPARAGRPPSGRCDSRGRAACRRGCACRRACSGSSTSGRRSSAGAQPMPTSCDQPNTSPLGRSRRSAAVRGRLPAGPGCEAVTR